MAAGRDNNRNHTNDHMESSPRLGANDLPSTPFPMTPGGLPSTPGFHFPNTPGLRSNGQLGSSQFSFLSSQSGEAIVGGGSQHQSSSLGNTTVRRRADLGSSSSILRGGRASIALGSSGGGSKRGNAALSSELGSENGRIATGGTPNEGDDEEEEEEELRVIWGTVVNIQDVVTKFRKFLLGFTTRHWVEYLEKQQGQGREESRPAALAGAEDEPLYTRLLDQMRQGEIRYLNLNARHLLALPESAKLYRLLVNYPEEVIPILDHVLTETYIHRFPDEYYDPDNFGLRVRPFNLMEAVNMRELNPSDIDKLVSIKGLMIRASNIIPDMQVAFFRCTSCEWTVTAGIERGVITEPTKCGNPNCLMRESMELVHNRSVFTDKQICKLQETPDVIPDGQTPHTVSLVMHDELVDVAKPGDRLEVTGIYRGVPVRINPRKRTVQALYRTYIDVVHIRRSSPSRVENDPNMVTNDNEYVADLHKLGVGEEDLVGGDRSDAANSLVVTEEEEKEFKRLAGDPRLMQILTRSLAPSIYEMEDVKRGLLLQLFGGVRKQFKRTGAPRSRGDIHVLMVGDPGVSKSQLLQAVHGIAPRGQYTSGKGSSAVGLTAYVTRDPDTRQLVLESGALVLSDGGVCCIDEFDKMSDFTRSILHEAMEQQTVSIAKAGIITSLNARAAILAAANPVDSKWNRDLSIVENINLPPTLVSRFDLVFIVLDLVEESMDRKLAKHLVSLYMDASEVAGAEGGAEGVDSTEVPTIPMHILTKYISYARRAVQPNITDEASDALVRAYLELRRQGRGDGTGAATTTSMAARGGPGKRVTATARQLESMIRMSEAHARMRLSPRVEVQDVDEALRLMREALRESATDPRTGLIDLDLLNTGFAASDRRQLDAIKSETRRLLLQQQQQGSGVGEKSGTVQQWLDRMNEQSSVPIAPRLFEQVLRELETEGMLGLVGGTGRNALVVIKRGEAGAVGRVLGGGGH